MEIRKIESLDFNKIHKVLTSGNITDGQKLQFIKNNNAEIHSIVELKLTGKDFGYMMKNRPLIKFRPIRNSYTKRGDKILLAKTLGIEPAEVDNYVELTSEKLNSLDAMSLNSIGLNPPSEDMIESVKTYVYRHGKKEQVVKFLDYELSHAKNILEILYKTLTYETGGVADYFLRPIHRMDNKTLVHIYNVVDKHLDKAQKNRLIDTQSREETARWALVRIYQIQNNQRLRNAIKAYNELS
ncbi:hypothetical protein IJ541_03560 [bacterium]|nr:hypothetical protein [bacterium]